MNGSTSWEGEQVKDFVQRLGMNGSKSWEGERVKDDLG